MGHQVVGYDNFSTGRRIFLSEAVLNPRFELVEGDLLDCGKLSSALGGCEIVFHLAANADVRFGTEHPTKDLHQNTIATVNVLEAMRAAGVKQIAFASTGSVYGEANISRRLRMRLSRFRPLFTALRNWLPKALSKRTVKASECRDLSFALSRFWGNATATGTCSIFISSCERIRIVAVLGNGKQRKSYLYVQDCIDAILTAIEKSKKQVSVFNLGRGRVLRSERLDWLDLQRARVGAGAPVFGRRSRLDRRQPVHLFGLFGGARL